MRAAGAVAGIPVGAAVVRGAAGVRGATRRMRLVHRYGRRFPGVLAMVSKACYSS